MQWLLHELKVKSKSESHSLVSDSLQAQVHGILQTIILECVAFLFSRGSSQPRDRIQVSRMKVSFMNWKGAEFTPSSVLWWVHSFSASRGQHLQANHNAEFLSASLPHWEIASCSLWLVWRCSQPTFLAFSWCQMGSRALSATSHCNHSSVPNKTLFCLMPGPLLWRTGLSPTSLDRAVPLSTVVRTPCFHCRDCGFSPWSEK